MGQHAGRALRDSGGVAAGGKDGHLLGYLNFFIVTPGIVASLGFGWVMAHLLGNNRLLAVVAGGVFFLWWRRG